MSSFTRTPNPNPNPNPNVKVAPPANSKQLTYDEVSKLFSSPLADAADSLGVSASALKKICHDNGLVRWPYRKFLLGKSIEQIKKDAAREKARRHKEALKISGSFCDNSAISTVVSFPSSLPQNKTTSSQVVSKSAAVMQTQGNKNVPVGAPQIFHGTNYTRGKDTDEFIYGFPSQGLSTVSHRWWGKSSSSGSMNNGMNAEDLENKGHDLSMGSLETEPLTSSRKRAAEEGREALKLGVHSRYAMNTLDSTKRMVLKQIFKSSLPTLKSDEFV